MLKMAANKQALKRSAQITNNSSISTPSKPIKPKISKRNDTEDKCHEEIDPTNGEIHSILQQIVMKLDIIDDRYKEIRSFPIFKSTIKKYFLHPDKNNNRTLHSK